METGGKVSMTTLRNVGRRRRRTTATDITAMSFKLSAGHSVQVPPTNVSVQPSGGGADPDPTDIDTHHFVGSGIYLSDPIPNNAFLHLYAYSSLGWSVEFFFDRTEQGN